MKDTLLALANRCETEGASRELDRAVEIALRGMLARQDFPPHRDPAEAAAALRARAAVAS